MKINLFKPYITGKELIYINDIISNGKDMAGDGEYTKKVHGLLEKKYNVKKALLTTSGTTALELAIRLLNLKKGDEIIAPSFTFSSTINAILLAQGVKVVFAEVDKDTLNIDPADIERKITRKTKAIMIVHYAGVSCDMDKIMAISKKRNLKVVEDAAQAIERKYKGKYLGTIGDFGCLSFHDTKNITCGEGGALFINTSNKKTQEKAEIIREKGTNRSKFFRGEIDKYTWVETGSSYLPSDILAAYLLAQLENSELITKKRMKVYDFYKRELDAFNTVGFYKIPVITKNSTHNAHIFYIVFNTTEDRDFVMSYFKKHNISAPFHYIPLHSAPRGVRMGYKASDLPLTEKLASCLIRLPIYSSMTKSESQKVVRIFKEAVKARILDVNSSKNSEVFIEKPRYSFVRNIFATLNLW